MTTPVEVEIYGSRYVIKGDAEPEYVRDLARYVDERMRALARKGPASMTPQKLAVLAAFNMADELHKLRKRQQEVDRIIVEKTGDLFDILGEG